MSKVITQQLVRVAGLLGASKRRVPVGGGKKVSSRPGPALATQHTIAVLQAQDEQRSSGLLYESNLRKLKTETKGASASAQRVLQRLQARQGR